MGGGGGVVGAIVGAVVTVVGVVTGQPEIVMMGITMMASSVISAVTAPKPPSFDQNATQLNTGSNLQVQPATTNKLPVVYGSAFIGGTITDLSITSDNQNLYYVLSLCEVTGNGSDVISFGDIYYGGKKVQLSGTTVTGLLDVSTGVVDTAVNGLIHIYLYNNGSSSPTNTTQSAISVMQSSGLTYTWDNNKAMTNTVFVIVQLTYNSNAGVTQIPQTQFEIINSRTNTGDVFYDYLTNEVYGAAIPLAQVDTASLTALTAYSNEMITFNNYLGVPSTQPRFKFNGAIDTTQTVMTNLQNMTQCCDCLLTYNEIYGVWSVIVQSPTAPIVMNINDSNIVSAITITSLDISNTYNIAECQFPDLTLNSSFNTSTIDLAVVDPTLMYPNEPQNSQTIKLPLVNNDVQAQLLATRFLKAARQDLQIQCTIDFTGLELEAGDIVSVTNANYGWNAKPFRILRVEQTFDSNSGITVSLLLQEYDSAVYNDAAITQYTPAPNTGLPSPNIFGTIPAPVVTGTQTNSVNPSIQLTVTSSSAGIIQYAEVYYSAYATPSSSQLMFAGTTEIAPSGLPYGNNVALPVVTLSNIPTGNWYFFTRMVNSLATSPFSPASAVLNWRPLTFQFTDRYLDVAFADDINGGGFSLDQTGKFYFGLYNSNTASTDLNPSDYQWYPADPVFGTDKYLLYINRGSRKFSFAVGTAGYASTTGRFVPTDTGTYDPSLWSGLPTLVDIIDLDARTGQLLGTGTSAVSSADGLLRVTNSPDGTVIASLQRFLNFGSGVYSKTFNVNALTIDVYGRVVGVTAQDPFYFTQLNYTATAGQTTFAVTHILNQCLVFKNGELLDTADYTETTSDIVLAVPASLDDRIVILNMRVTAYDKFYYPLNITVASVSGNDLYYSSSSSPFQYIVAGDKLTFSNTGTPTSYTVSAVNYTTRKITFTTAPTATAGDSIYNFVAKDANYRPFSRYTANVTSASDYTPTDWGVNSGYEMPFINGVAINEADYDIAVNTITGFPSAVTGKITWIQFAANNLGVSCASVQNAISYSTAGQAVYSVDHNIAAFQAYFNGAILSLGDDYTDTATDITLLNIPNNSYTLIQLQSYNRSGAA